MNPHISKCIDSCFLNLTSSASAEFRITAHSAKRARIYMRPVGYSRHTAMQVSNILNLWLVEYLDVIPM